jgi:predicted acyltransferase (DUF342 family)
MSGPRDINRVNILNKKNLRYFLEFLGIKAGTESDDILTYSDITAKYDLYVEGRVIAVGPVSASNTVTLDEAADFNIWQDLVVQHDATVKDEFYVEGNAEIGHDFKVLGDSLTQFDSTVKGDMKIGGNVEVRDLFVHQDAVVQHDMTVREDIYVLNEEGGHRGITTDITATGMIYKVVQGIIVRAVQK